MTLHSKHWLQPLDKMQRISRQEFAERIDEILDTLDKEDIGYVITSDGKDDLVACPTRWFITEPSDDFGLIVNSAVRYAIGRETYMPSTVINHVRQHVHMLDGRTIQCIINDIKREQGNTKLYNYDEWMKLCQELEQFIKETTTKE